MPSPLPWSRGGAPTTPPSPQPASATWCLGASTRPARRPRPSIPDKAPEIQSHKVSYKLHKPISQFLPPPPQANMGPPSNPRGGGAFLGNAP